jgi:predicted transcriptional regulator
MGQKKTFTEEQDQWLLEYYQIAQWKDVIKKIGKSQQAIIEHCKKNLKLVKGDFIDKQSPTNYQLRLYLNGVEIKTKFASSRNHRNKIMNEWKENIQRIEARTHKGEWYIGITQ